MAEGDGELERPFGFWTALALVVGGMIGAGIFVLPAQLAPYGATGIAAWIIAILGAMLLGLVIAALVEARPDAPGLVTLCGEILGPLAGLLIGWNYWIAVWASLAVLAATASSYLAMFVPAFARTPLHLVVTAIAILWALTLLNLAGLRSAGRFQVLTSVLKVVPLIAVLLVLAGIALGGGAEFGRHSPAPIDPGQLSPAVILVFFALLGFESASIVTERVRNSARNVPLATLTGVALVGGLYLLVSTGMVFAMPSEVLAQSSTPIADFVARFWGGWSGLAVGAFAAISAIGCLNGWVLVQGEMVLGMSRDSLLPHWLGTLNRGGVAWIPIVASSILASLLLLSNVSRGTAGLFDFMMRLTSASSLFVYFSFCVVALRIGVRRRIAVLALAFTLWAMWGAGIEVTLLGVALMLTALPFYWLARRSAVSSAAAS
jgi:APA family basic amino acid/polyamine antiporter